MCPTPAIGHDDGSLGTGDGEHQGTGTPIASPVVASAGGTDDYAVTTTTPLFKRIIPEWDANMLDDCTLALSNSTLQKDSDDYYRGMEPDPVVPNSLVDPLPSSS